VAAREAISSTGSSNILWYSPEREERSNLAMVVMLVALQFHMRLSVQKRESTCHIKVFCIANLIESY
jgi:hypothetical protein